MRWYHYLAYFFGGIFLANALPHLGNGVSGHAFQSPFANPPGVGLSSSTVNALWGFFNLAVSYLLVCRVGNFELLSAGVPGRELRTAQDATCPRLRDGHAGDVAKSCSLFRAVPRRNVNLERM
jgi:hypothetical protein